MAQHACMVVLHLQTASHLASTMRHTAARHYTKWLADNGRL